MSWKMNAGLMIALAHGIFGGINLVVFVLSGASMLHMGVLGALALVVGGGLYTRRPWFLWPALALAPLTLTVGMSTLYASLGFGGFNPSPQGLLFNLGLLAYVMAALFLLYYLISKRGTLFQ